jgi:hypothetical protein
MKYFFIFLFFISPLATAQLINQEMHCSGDTKKDIPFSLHLQGKAATVILRDEAYQLDFKRSFIDKNGFKWSVYEDKTLTLSVQRGKDSYANLFRKEWNYQLQMDMRHPLSSSSCK